MFHEMRKKERKIAEEETIQLLEKCTYGVLSTVGEDGYCYGVPLSYVYEDGVIYFHCAGGVGHKLENIAYNNKVSFTIIGDTETLPAKFSTKYESAVVFGTVIPVEDKFHALKVICEKYSPDFEVEGEKYAKAAEAQVGVYELRIEHMTGKARR